MSLLTAYETLRDHVIDASKKLFGWLGHAQPNEKGKLPTIGLLESSTSTFLFVWLGLMRLGFSVLLIA